MVQLPEQFQLDLLIFGGRFDHQIGILGCGGQAGTGMNAGQGGVPALLIQAAFGNHPVQIPGNGGHGLLQGGGRKVNQLHMVAAGCKNLGDAVAHGSTTDHGNFLDGRSRAVAGRGGGL